MTDDPIFLRVAVAVPVRRLFDYRPPEAATAAELAPGMRVRVRFAGRILIGVIIELATQTQIAPAKVKPVLELLDREPLLPAEVLDLLVWAAGYYHHPPGEVVSAALPKRLREGGPAQARGVTRWRLTAAGRDADLAPLARAPRRREVMQRLAASPDGLTSSELPGSNPGASLKVLAGHGWVESYAGPCLEVEVGDPQPAPLLNPAQAAAVSAIGGVPGFVPWLLDGVTGSGKTEVYIGAIEKVLASGRQALVLVPEIGLAPQTVGRFRRRLGVAVAVLHSGLNDGERLCAWLAAARGEARVVIGTRSAVFIPLPDLGLVVVDEEHDASYKQQDGFRYSARDLAVMRARRRQVPVVLGSATPGLESLLNVIGERYRRLDLPQRAGVAVPPATRIIDLRGKRSEAGLSEPLLKAVRERLLRGEQSLLFINRRGYAPTVMCHSCGWVAECQNCDARLTLYREAGHLRCRHCGVVRGLPKACGDCGSTALRTLGVGTERVEEALRGHFPDARIARVDRDSMSRRGAMEQLVEQARDGHIQILLGTQMLAKGHDFPGVTLVGVLDADQGLFGIDFRATERMAQLVVQVAGRAGRADKPGEFLIQTHHPDHPLLRELLTHGYRRFAQLVLDERRLAGLPPYIGMALLRAEAESAEPAHEFLRRARDSARALAIPGVDLFGPIPAPMERRAGRFRAQLLLQAPRRAALQRLLQLWVPGLETAKAPRELRWALDVDPVEML